MKHDLHLGAPYHTIPLGGRNAASRAVRIVHQLPSFIVLKLMFMFPRTYSTCDLEYTYGCIVTSKTKPRLAACKGVFLWLVGTWWRLMTRLWLNHPRLEGIEPGVA